MKRSALRWAIGSLLVSFLVVPATGCEADPTGAGLLAPFQLPEAGNFNPPEAGALAPRDAGLVSPPDAARPSDAAAPNEAGADGGGRAAACDDGKLDLGETCDPLSSCPTACPPVGCQLRALQNAGTCTATCVSTGMQTACASGDGCCPPGCNAANDNDCVVTCDNGVVENGETCDPLASCPTTCPTVGCQQRALEGGGTCAARCVDSSLVTTCVGGDGCCPPGCNANDDSDCGPGCGNNVVEPGEACDPLTSCPSSCPPVGCQLRTLANAGTCQAACVDAGTINVCTSNDGCCPSGCNANNDNDCLPTCDNGVIEAGETCDPLASCPRGCSQQQCQLYAMQESGTCAARCVPSGTQTSCVDSDNCCPSGCNATNDNDCAAVCGNGVVEGRETCDSNCPVCQPGPYTCYGTGTAATCDVNCSAPVTTCGPNNDRCCPFGGGKCGSDSDSDCAGAQWQWIKLADVDTSNGCHRFFVSVEVGGSYDFTTCGPDEKSVGTGNPDITEVLDYATRASYGMEDANCATADALPRLAGWTCKNAAGENAGACASPSPGGFQAVGNVIELNICPGLRFSCPAGSKFCYFVPDSGVTPLYVWYNAPKTPTFFNPIY